MRLFRSAVKIPTPLKREFNLYVQKSNASRIVVIAIIAAIYEFLVMMYEVLEYSGNPDYKSAIIMKLTFVMVCSSVAVIIGKFAKKDKDRGIEIISSIFVFIICLLGVTNTFLTQAIMPAIATFLITVYSCVTIVRTKPVISFSIYGFITICFFVGIPFFQTDPQYVLWHRANGVLSMSVVMALAYILYQQSALIFMEKHQIIQQNKKLDYLANYDELTDVFNYRRLRSKLEELKIAAKVNNTPLSLAIIDVDNFKQINDTYGHRIGDKVIEHLAEILKTYCSDMYYVGRYGGDEFVIILPMTGREQAYHFCQAIKEHIQEHDFDLVNKRLSLTISCGVAELSEDSFENVLEKADNALYVSKREGKNKVSIS